MISRPNWHEYFMAFCNIAALRSSCDRKHVGAIAVRDNRILSVGYNGSLSGQIHCNERKCIRCGWVDEEAVIPRDGLITDGDCPHCSNDISPESGTVRGGHYIENGHCLRVLHSEQNMVAHAARAGVSLDGATAYCNTKPCWECLKLMIAAGIKKVIYQDDYPSAGKGPTQDFLDQVKAKSKYTEPSFKLIPYSSLQDAKGRK